MPINRFRDSTQFKQASVPLSDSITWSSRPSKVMKRCESALLPHVNTELLPSGIFAGLFDYGFFAAQVLWLGRDNSVRINSGNVLPTSELYAAMKGVVNWQSTCSSFKN